MIMMMMMMMMMRAAMFGSQETDCKGGMTHTEWCNPCTSDDERLHPRAFKPEEVSRTMLERLRTAEADWCNATGAAAWAAEGLVSAAQLAAGQHCGTLPAFWCGSEARAANRRARLVVFKTSLCVATFLPHPPPPAGGGDLGANIFDGTHMLVSPAEV
jgi:hypothetical protein